MCTSLIARQLPAFVNDSLGSVNYGPKLLSYSNEIMDFSGHKMTLEEAMRASSDNKTVRDAAMRLIVGLRQADPRVHLKRKVGFLAAVWNALTGYREAKLIEFNLYCRKVDRLVAEAPAILSQANESLNIISALEKIYQDDIKKLDEYIRQGKQFIIEAYDQDEPLSSQFEYGITRLQQRIVNLEVTKATMEMSLIQTGMLLQAAISNLDVLNECVKSVIPMWHHQIKQFRSGAADIDIDPQADKRFRDLVNKLNNNLKKAK